MIWYILGFILLFPVILTIYYMVKYRNPFKLIFIFGKKGTGKTTTLTMLSCKYHKYGWNIYSTEKVPYARVFNPKHFGTYRFPEHSVVLVDECSLIWGNRDFKNFQKGVERQFRFQRHDKLRIYLFSQTFDVDLKIRNLADSMYLATKLFNCITWLKAIDKSVVLTKSDSSGQSRIAEDLRFEPFIFWPFGTRMLIWIPKWAKLFDSFDTFDDQRPDIPFEEWQPAAAASASELPTSPLSPPPDSFDCSSVQRRD